MRADQVNALNAAQAAEHARDAAMADVNGLHEQNRQLAADCNRLGLQADKANARAKEAEQQLDGARQVAEAAKMRADKWQKRSKPPRRSLWQPWWMRKRSTAAPTSWPPT